MSYRFASSQDLEACKQVHRQYGTTYYYATRRFPANVRKQVHAIYAFVRIADEWVDNPASLSTNEQHDLLEGWRDQLTRGLTGNAPEHWAMRAFCDAVLECDIPVSEAHCFIDAMIQDIHRTEYETYDELCQYMRGSASAVGIMMCYAMGMMPDGDTLRRARALGEAMQMTNFLRDIGEDIRDRGRVYVPQEDLRQFGVTRSSLENGELSEQFFELMKFEIERTRTLYRESDLGILRLPARMRKAVLVSRILYEGILGQIEKNGYDVFCKRARTSRLQKVICAAEVAADDRRVLNRLVASGGVK